MTPTPSQEERREAIARIVDPAAWNPSSKATDAAYRARQDRALAKADAIIALDPPTFPVSEEGARECLAAHAGCDADSVRRGSPILIDVSMAIHAMLAFAAFRGSGVAPQASDAPLRGQALLASLPEPVPVSALPGDDPSRGWNSPFDYRLARTPYLVLPKLALQVMPLDWQWRFEDLLKAMEAVGIETPVYEVVPEGGEIRQKKCRDKDDWRYGEIIPVASIDDPWADYRHMQREKVAALCPDFASGIEAAVADETRSGSAEGESPVSEAETPNPDPQNTPDPTPLSGKD